MKVSVTVIATALTLCVQGQSYGQYKHVINWLGPCCGWRPLPGYTDGCANVRYPGRGGIEVYQNCWAKGPNSLCGSACKKLKGQSFGCEPYGDPTVCICTNSSPTLTKPC
ncbi:hypothetical protein Ptr902_13001 [Pyrenophora tritici-repentis]|uniref:Uncharacterized protein n=1 Tax=Pyrenophora tritici-repentis TaxID=45151 RepID=A0A834W124_9PLEO|nr:hypothetical protein A1F99_129560 [Pyrenophora tritici-repentis]KAF7449932.1 hypothetical protein A1F99_045480 [Pyrenophora tritici-repentis]KAF7579562.1 hypothetical protein PtrM4_038020 [Pyrenophora tritici-repentis]KAI0568674.1 hypothetical protein Alg215_12050 [Pyrenophora tritici-repentis]KAI0569042.1 hypothetical protein Alg130_11814 [Pyrenophora tritici-repentis]